MNYQSQLLNRKGRFGLIWLAAHHAGKLSKTEILQLDLCEKCEEIKQLVLNDRTRRTGVSLLVSSHLMYGLVVLLNKKNGYLFDDLVYLKTQLHASYFTVTKLKTPSKRAKTVTVAAERQQVTLKENLPELFLAGEITKGISFDTLIEFEKNRLEKELQSIRLQEEQRVVPRARITLDETMDIDIIDRSTLIPIEYDYRQDTFQVIDMEESAVERARRETLGATGAVETTSILNLLSTNYLEKTIAGQKSEISTSTKRSIQLREPFTDVSNIPEYGAPPRLFDETSIMVRTEQEMSLEGRAEPTLIVPEGMLEFMPPAAPQAPEEITAIAAEVPSEIAQPALPRTISLELQEIEERRTRQMQARREARERRRRNLIVDQRIEISNAEMKKRLASIYEREEEPEVEGEMTTLERIFMTQNTSWTRTKFDYLAQDLFKHPITAMARNTFKTYEIGELNRYFIKSSLISRNMKTTSEPNHTYSYLTRATELAELIEAGEYPRERREPEEYGAHAQTIETSEVEMARKSISAGAGLGEPSMRVDESVKRRTSRLSTTDIRVNETGAPIDLSHLEAQQTAAESMMVEQRQFEETLMPPPFPEMPAEMFIPPVPVEQPVISERDFDYANMILEKLQETRSFILQELIKETSPSEKSLKSARPRAINACKFFSATLKLCASQQISVQQKAMYANIKIKAI